MAAYKLYKGGTTHERRERDRDLFAGKREY